MNGVRLQWQAINHIIQSQYNTRWSPDVYYVYLATLGQRPEALTIAYDRLSERYNYSVFGLLHTDRQVSDIAAAHQELSQVLSTDYPGLTLHHHEITRVNGLPLLDIEGATDAETYYDGVLNVLQSYKEQHYQIHLMIAGGRKAMSIYAMLAASLVFEPPHDRVWTVLSPAKLLAQRGGYHVPIGMRDQVQIVELPVITSRVAPGVSPKDVLRSRSNKRAAFLAKLSRQELALAELLTEQPYATSKQLAELLHKSERTIENQFRSIYDKMIGFLDLGERVSNKRQALLDVLR